MWIWGRPDSQLKMSAKSLYNSQGGKDYNQKKTTARQKQLTFQGGSETASNSTAQETWAETFGPATHTDDPNTFLLKKNQTKTKQKVLFSFANLTVVRERLIPSDSSNLSKDSSNLEAVSRR